MAPGTLGSLIGLSLAYGLAQINWLPAALLSILLILASVPITTEAARILKTDDPGSIVLDEIAGMVVALHGIAFSAGIGLRRRNHLELAGLRFHKCSFNLREIIDA